MTSFQDQAIQFSLASKWQEACQANELILQTDPEDIDALNRLGFALMQLGEFDRSKTGFETVIAIDESNPIAAKNLKKLGSLEGSGRAPKTDLSPRIQAFIEEAGKTKTVALINLTDRKTLSVLQPGHAVSMVVKRSKVFIQTLENLYIGTLPHDLGIRLIEFIREGNTYDAFVKGVEEKEVEVFIREATRCKKFANHPSFPSGMPQRRMKRRAVAI